MATILPVYLWVLSKLVDGWIDLDTARQVHTSFEVIALTLFGVLVLCEIMEHRGKMAYGTLGIVCFGLAIAGEMAAFTYSERNDSLSEGAIKTLAQLSTDAKSDAGKARKDAGDAEADLRGVRTSINQVRSTVKDFAGDFETLRSKADEASDEILAITPRVLTFKDGEEHDLNDFYGGPIQILDDPGVIGSAELALSIKEQIGRRKNNVTIDHDATPNQLMPGVRISCFFNAEQNFWGKRAAETLATALSRNHEDVTVRCSIAQANSMFIEIGPKCFRTYPCRTGPKD